MSSLISTFIDDEMNLDEKIEFVETVWEDPFFAQETLAFLSQEKMLRGSLMTVSPPIDIKASYSWKRFFKPLTFGAAALATLLVFLFSFMPPSRPTGQTVANRFIIYQPDVKAVDISGTFTEWARLPMKKIGDSGYWEISLAIAAGEHRYTYILDGRRSFSDPTKPFRERDDFGGYNSVIFVEKKA